jgi:hypothetical protein
MNIYDFVDSRDIAEYWQKIDYKCTPLECAYLIHKSLTATLESKWSAWQEIIDTMPDSIIPERRWLKEQSLHHLIKREMAFQKLIVDEFNDETNSVYTFCMYSDGEYSDCRRVYKTKASCFEGIKEYLEDETITKIRVRKQVIDCPDKFVFVYFNRDLRPIEVYGVDFNKVDNPPENKDDDIGFEGLWLSFPTPFKRGDIVVDKDFGNIAVLDCMATWTSEEMKANGMTGDDKYFAGEDRVLALHKKDGDETDMCSGGYFYDSEYGFDHDHIDNYLNIEYVRDELKGTDRVLIALSNYIKGKIDIELLCYAVDLLTKEEEYLTTKRNEWFTAEGLRLAGIRESVGINNNGNQ